MKLELSFAVKTRIYAKLITLGNVSVPESFNHKVLEYVCCTYSKNLWTGLITDIDMEEKDAKIKFLHPFLPSTSFVWPQRDDTGCHFQIFIVDQCSFSNNIRTNLYDYR